MSFSNLWEPLVVCISPIWSTWKKMQFLWKQFLAWLYIFFSYIDSTCNFKFRFLPKLNKLVICLICICICVCKICNVHLFKKNPCFQDFVQYEILKIKYFYSGNNNLWQILKISYIDCVKYRSFVYQENDEFYNDTPFCCIALK